MLLVLLTFSRRRGTPLGELMLVRRGHDAFTRESAKQPAGGGWYGNSWQSFYLLYFLTTVYNQDSEVLERCQC